MLARAGMRLADFCERWFPDAFVFALAAIVIVFCVLMSIYLSVIDSFLSWLVGKIL